MNADYPVIVKTYNLTLWYIKKLNSLPKNLGQNVLQLDIRKFFPSIDHKILFDLLCKKIESLEGIKLLKNLIDNSKKVRYDSIGGVGFFNQLHYQRKIL